MPPSTDSPQTPSRSASGSPGPQAFDDPPDDLFALVAGLTAALVVAPFLTALAGRVVADSGVLYPVLLACLLLSTVVGTLLVRRRRGAPERLGATRARWVPALVGPAAVAAGVVFAVGDPTGTETVLGTVAAVGGFAGGGILGIMARSRYTKAVVEASEQYATWRAGWSDRRRRPLRALGVLAVVAGIVAFVVGIVAHVDILQTATNVLVPLGAVVFMSGQTRTYSATAAGLEERMPAARTLSEWDRFEGYVVADDAVVVHRRAPWRLPAIFAREDLDDEAAVVDALDRQLPRLPAPRD